MFEVDVDGAQGVNLDVGAGLAVDLAEILDGCHEVHSQLEYV
jgi:hypothetical protein